MSEQRLNFDSIFRAEVSSRGFFDIEIEAFIFVGPLASLMELIVPNVSRTSIAFAFHEAGLPGAIE